MNKSPISFAKLLENTIAFDDPPDDEDNYVPSPPPISSSSPSSSSTPHHIISGQHSLPAKPVTQDPFTIFSQNARKSNTTTHAILNVASSLSPPADLILIQEPYFGKIGINAQMAQGNPIVDVLGTPKHRDWQAILPQSSSLSDPPDVMFYIPTKRAKWTFQIRSDIVSTSCLTCIEIKSDSDSFFVFNVYNDVDNGACDLLASLPAVPKRSIFLGDFNLHHPLWSSDDNLDKHSSRSDRLVEMFAQNGYSVLNERGVETFFCYRHNPTLNRNELYTSTLDLAWSSNDLLRNITRFTVAHHLANGSDHYPCILEIGYEQSTRTGGYSFKEEKFQIWCDSFTHHLHLLPPIPTHIHDADTLKQAIDHLQSAAVSASNQVCRRREGKARHATWFDSKVKTALTDMRKSLRNLKLYPSQHNALRYHVARKQFNYQVAVSKRSHARAFAASVKPGADLWRLTSWYQGIRKTTIPTLKAPSSDPKFPIWVSDSAEKADLLANSWFPVVTSSTLTDPPPHVFPPSPTRAWKPVTKEEVLDTLKKCSSDNAPGISGLTYRVWK